MKKIKIFFFVVFAGLFATLFFQNREFFMTEKMFGINLLLVDYSTPQIPVLYMFFVSFLFGLAVACLFAFPKLIRYKKIIKNMNADLKVCRDKIRSSEEDKESAGSGKKFP